MKIGRCLVILAIAPIAFLVACGAKDELLDRYQIVIDYSNFWTRDGAYYGCSLNTESGLTCTRFSQEELRPHESAIYEYVSIEMVDRIAELGGGKNMETLTAGPIHTVLWEHKSKPLLMTWSDDFYWQTPDGFKYEGVWLLSSIAMESVMPSTLRKISLVNSQNCKATATALIARINNSLPNDKRLPAQFECEYELAGPFPGVDRLHKISIGWQHNANGRTEANFESTNGVYWNWIPSGEVIEEKPEHWWQNYRSLEK